MNIHSLKIREKISLRTGFIVFMIVPLFFPRGFLSVRACDLVFKTWTYISFFLAVLYILYKAKEILKNIKSDKTLCFVMIYHFSLLLITLIVQHRITEGIQKIFVVPVFCLFLYTILQTKRKKVIKVLSNYLIVLFFVNDFIFTPSIMLRIVSRYHINFLGHVQVSAQYAILGILLAIVNIEYYCKTTGKILIFLSTIVLIISEALAGYAVLAIIVLSYFLRNKRKFVKFVNKYIMQLFVIIIIISFLLIITSVKYKLYRKVSFDLTYSGRVYVWNSAWELIKEHLILGYGAYGVLITVFWMKWNNSDGMNYAHSEIMQLLLDGGIILLIVYFILLVLFIKQIRRINNINKKYWISILLMAFLSVALFESVTDYPYFFAFMIIIITNRNCYKYKV